VWESAASSDTAREVGYFLNSIPIVSISTHPRLVPPGVPFPAPAIPFGQGRGGICGEGSDAHAYENGQLLENRIAHEATVQEGAK
jgi:hypothetical protein